MGATVYLGGDVNSKTVDTHRNKHVSISGGGRVCADGGRPPASPVSGQFLTWHSAQFTAVPNNSDESLFLSYFLLRSAKKFYCS